MTGGPWDDHGWALLLRRYQQRAVDVFERVRGGQRKFYLVAPPGSGKTLLGLRLAAELGAPALALSPTTTIAAQWLARLADAFRRVTGEGPPVRGSLAVDGEAALYSLTYQRLAVAADDGGSHPNVEALHAALAAHGVRTLLLDECHHLRGTWGEAVEALLARLPGTFVVGVTATPARQADGPLARLLGEPDHEISLPSVIRTGDLAPFQELVLVTTPSRDECALLAGRAGALERGWTALLGRAPWRGAPTLDEAIDAFAAAPRLAGIPTTLAAALAAEPDLVIAAMRHLTACDRFHPAEMPPLPEIEEPLTLGDRARLLAWYLAEHGAGAVPERLAEAAEGSVALPRGLAGLPGSPADLPGSPAAPAAELAELPEVLAAFGFPLPGHGAAAAGEIRDTVGFSREKLAALREIAGVELAAQGDGARLLVLTDYELPPAGRRAISCRDVVEALVADPALDVLDPVMVTGRSLVVDDDLWPRFADELAGIAARDGLDLAHAPLVAGGAVEVRGHGADWSTRVLVGLVTELLERGVTRCVVGTKSLLGEGWDCLRLNALVDLTVVTSGVTVNQIRGRTLRLDPDDPAKVANNWDVLCFSPEAGDYELARLRERHDQLWGVAPDGSVERGLGHLHPWLATGWQELGPRREALNAEMRRRAGAREVARGWWRVGQPFADESWPALELRSRPARRRREGVPATAGAEPEAAAAEGLTVTGRGHDRLARLRWGALAGAAAAAGAVGVAAGPTALAGLAALPFAVAWAALAAADRRLLAGASGEADLTSLAGVLLAASGGSGEATVRRSGTDTLVVAWEGVEAERAEALTRSLAELLGTGHGQRYLLRERGFLRAGWRWRRLDRTWPVPRAHGGKRAVERFVAAWRALRDPGAEVFHVDAPEGRALLLRHWRRGPAAVPRVRRLWR